MRGISTVQGNNVGSQLDDLVASDVRIGRHADHFDIRVPRQLVRQNPAHNAESSIMSTRTRRGGEVPVSGCVFIALHGQATAS